MPLPLKSHVFAGMPAGKCAIQFRHKRSGTTETAAPIHKSKLVKVAKPNSQNAIVAITGAIKTTNGFKSSAIAKLKIVSNPRRRRGNNPDFCLIARTHHKQKRTLNNWNASIAGSGKVVRE